MAAIRRLTSSSRSLCRRQSDIGKTGGVDHTVQRHVVVDPFRADLDGKRAVDLADYPRKSFRRHPAPVQFRDHINAVVNLVVREPQNSGRRRESIIRAPPNFPFSRNRERVTNMNSRIPFHPTVTDIAGSTRRARY